MSISNEKIKLTANFLNGLAVAAMALGSLGPMVQGLTATNMNTNWGIVLGWLAAGAVIHILARAVLDDLEA